MSAVLTGGGCSMQQSLGPRAACCQTAAKCGWALSAGQHLFEASEAAAETSSKRRWHRPGRQNKERLKQRHMQQYKAYLAFNRTAAGKQRQQARKQLPAFAARDELLQALKGHQVCATQLVV